MATNFIDDCINIYNNYCHPILFDNIDRPPFWPVIVMALIIFLAVGEIGSQSCENGGCNHYKNIEKSSSNNSTSDIDTLISRVKINHTVVGWRRALIAAMLLSLVILFLFYPGLPDGFDFFLVATFLFLIIYFITAWFQWHWWKARDFKIEEKLLRLRHNIKDDEIDRELEGNYHGDSIMNTIESILSEN